MRWLLILTLLVSGCASAPKLPERPAPIISAPVVAAQVQKDLYIRAAVDRIDAGITASAVEAVVKQETAAIRLAIDEAPATQVANLAVDFNAAIKSLETRNSALLRQLEEERTRALRDQVKWLNWAGIGLLGAFGLSIFFGNIAAMAKTWPLLLLAGGCFGLAQVVSHPWFMRGFLGIGALGLGYLVYWVIDRQKQGRLREAVQKRANLLKQLVPVLDSAYENAEESVKKVLDDKVFDRLSSIMDAEDKAAVHEVRASAARHDDPPPPT